MNKEFQNINNQIKEQIRECYKQKGFIAQPDYTGFLIENDNYTKSAVRTNRRVLK
jgi:hypothetical protein